MAGHSKWANIKFRKEKQDAKKGKVFTKIIREITVSARMGGGDINSNPRLRDAITKAYKANLKKDNIEAAIKRGIQKDNNEQLQEVHYEGYGPGGIAFYVECLTDNKNRTVSDVRSTLTKYHGHLGATGSVSYLFKREGIIVLPGNIDEDLLLDLAAKYGGDDIDKTDDGKIEIVVEPHHYHAFIEQLNLIKIEPEYSTLTMLPLQKVKVGKDHMDTLNKLIDTLDDLDDVQNVYTNAELEEK